MDQAPEAHRPPRATPPANHMRSPTLATLSGVLGEDLAPVRGFTLPSVHVAAVHVSELADPRPYLNGGELLLTTGLTLPRTRVGCAQYVARLRSIGVVAIGIGLGPRFDAPPPVLIAACEENEVPLLIVPGPTPFLKVTTAFWELQTESSTQHLQDAVDAQRALVDAATAPDPKSAILSRLASIVNGWAALLAPDGSLQEVHPVRQRDAVFEVHRELARLEAVGVSSAASHIVGGHSIAVYPLAIERSLVGQVAVGTAETLPTLDRHVVQLAVNLLSIAALERERKRSTHETKQAAVAMLVDMAAVPAARRLAAALALGDLGRDARTVLVRTTRGPAVARALRTSLAHALPGPTDSDGLWYLVLGDSPITMDDLTSCLMEADPDSATIVSHRARLEDTGLIRARLTRILDTQANGTVVQERMPLGTDSAIECVVDQLVADGDTIALTTLIAYLRHRGSWERAAGELQVHRNTLRYRIERLRTIVGVNIDAPDDAARLWLTLRERGMA